ncbi:hypothetical protein KDL45_02750 [bacterium]|nr:hypothetical protein [bacterium]
MIATFVVAGAREASAQCVAPGGGPTTRLYANAAEGDLYSPVGISMAGYGGRDGVTHPFAKSIGGSSGWMDRPNVKAVTLDNGADRLVIARGTLVFVSDILYAKVIDKVCELSGVDLTEKLWLSGTHTHSGPSHFYPIPSLFGSAGFDVYDENVTQRIADSVASVIVASMEDLQPARFASTIRTPFDPTDRVTRKRRCESNPATKEDRVFFARIDREDGSPLAALMGWGMHGTLNGNELLNSDAPGAAEYGLEQTFDEPVPVLFLQGAGGDQSPTPSQLGYRDQGQLEWLALEHGPRLRELWDSLSPSSNLTFEMVSKRLPISREAISYEDGEFGYSTYFGLFPKDGEFVEYSEGAFYCGDPNLIGYYAQYDSIADCNNLDTRLRDGYYGCMIAGQWVPFWTFFIKQTQISNVRLGDQILSLMPGELTSPLAAYLREQIADEAGWDPQNIAAFGYAQGSQLYLLRPWDWVQGGYETSMNFWGPKFGDWLAEQNASLAGQLTTPADEDNETGAPPPMVHPDKPADISTELEKGRRAGRLIESPAAGYTRMESVELVWNGGYTGVDMPRVVVERQGEGGPFAPYLDRTGRVVSDAGLATRVTYTPVPNYDERRHPRPRRHEWHFTWETNHDDPAGIYRLRVTGKNYNGASVEDYEIVTDPFELIAADTLTAEVVSVTPLGGNVYDVKFRALYPPNPNGWRVRNVDYAPFEAAPARPYDKLYAEIQLQGGGVKAVEAYPADAEHWASPVVLQAGQAPVSVSVPEGGATDAYGNINGEKSAAYPWP